MCGVAGSKYTWRLYLRSLFSVTTINPLENVGLGKILHIFAALMGMLQMLPLILDNLHFSCINAIFLIKTILEIRSFSFSFFFLSFNSSGDVTLNTALIQVLMVCSANITGSLFYWSKEILSFATFFFLGTSFDIFSEFLDFRWFNFSIFSVSISEFSWYLLFYILIVLLDSFGASFFIF